MSEREKLKPEEKVKIVIKYIAGEDRRGRHKKDQVSRIELEKAQIEIKQLKHKLYLAEMERDLLKKLDEIERRDAFRK